MTSSRSRAILGVNLSHTRSACLLMNGRIHTAIAEERLDRVKKSAGQDEPPIPWRSITACLQAAGLGLDDLDAVVCNTCISEDVDELRAAFPLKNPRRLVLLPAPSHHLAHACATYYCSPFERSAILVADEWGSALTPTSLESESIFLGDQHRISLVQQNRRNHGANLSLGQLYNFFTIALGFILREEQPESFSFGGGGWEEAGKTMGLAPFGKPRKRWPALVERRPDGPFVSVQTLHRFAASLGVAQSDIFTRGELEGQFLVARRSGNNAFTALHRDLAYKAQQELEGALLHLAHIAYERTGCEYLCIGGGIGLNSIVNRKLLEATPFQNVFILPAATDDGNAIGCALYGWHVLHGRRRRFRLQHTYLGRPYSAGECSAAIKEAVLGQVVIQRKFNIAHDVRPHPHICRAVAERLAAGKVVGWFQGGSEFGPRALGHRSILADPRRHNAKALVNRKVKQREAFRPYAPSVLLEDCSDFFDIEGASPYMLMVAPVRPDKRSLIPGVVHVDGTARLQTVSRDAAPRFYELIAEFKQLTGIPVLLNTSLNRRGEPIVETPEDALEVFFNSGLDCLVLGDFLLDK